MLFGFAALAADAVAQSTNAPLQLAVVFTKSSFIDDKKFGRDPFFPKSPRRTVVETNTPPPEVKVTPVDWLKVGGYSVTAGRRLIIINNYTFAEGDSWDLKHEGKTMRVRCVKITEQAVTVTVNDTSHDLPIRAAL
jgi:hypothetical protein